MPLLIPVITILMLLMIAACITNCLTHFVSAQVSKIKHAVPVQQGYIKLQPTMENDTPLDGHCYKDSGLRLATGGGPIFLTVPVQQKVARETSVPLF